MARSSEQLINAGLSHPNPTTLGLVFLGGLLTSLGPCSLSLLPITIAYLGGFKSNQAAFFRSFIFCSGIIFSLIVLGSISGLVGSIYGKVPLIISSGVAILSIAMGLALLGVIQIQMPLGPDPIALQRKLHLPNQLAPFGAGLAFGLASSPCTTPVLAILISWIAANGNVISGIMLLTFFGLGQVLPLIGAGTIAGIIPNLLSIKSITRFIPRLSGIVFISIGLLRLLSQWI